MSKVLTISQLEQQNSGYGVLRGKRLQKLQLAISEQYVAEIDFVNIKGLNTQQ